MSYDEKRKFVRMVRFTVRKDKHLGLLIEKYSTDKDEYFVKPQDQPLYRHCEQMQKIVQAANIQRTKVIPVDTADFDMEYFRDSKGWFKGHPLNSVNQQIDKICGLYANKEVGMKKRAETIARNKQSKIEEYNAKILNKIQGAEERFRHLLAIRMEEAFGSTTSGPQPGSGTTETPPGSGTPDVPVATVSPHVPENDEQNDEPNDEPMEHDQRGISDTEF